MNTSLMLLIALTAVGALAVPPALALEQAYPGTSDEGREKAKMAILDEVPIAVWTDQTTYDHNSVIEVKGNVANVITGIPVTLTVTNPLNSVVTIDQIDVNDDGSFVTMISTAGQLWKYDGIYSLKVNYGSAEKNNKVLIELTDGEDYRSTPAMPAPSQDGCQASDISVDGYCIPYTIEGGSVTGASINSDDNSITIMINAEEDGVLKLSPSTDVIDDIFMVLVDGEEWDDAYFVDDMIKIKFLAGAEEIELIATFVIPEFGTIAVMILAVAIISIIAVTARSRLSIMPRY